MADAIVLLVLVLWSGFHTPEVCHGLIREAVAHQMWKGKIDLPDVQVPPTCIYLMEDWEKKLLNVPK